MGEILLVLVIDAAMIFNDSGEDGRSVDRLTVEVSSWLDTNCLPLFAFASSIY